MKEQQIMVVIKEPGKEPYVDPLFDNTLEAFQKAVGGYIETVRIAEDLLIVCNEEGLINNLPFNTKVCGYPLFGTVVGLGIKGDGFASLKAACIPAVRRLLSRGK